MKQIYLHGLGQTPDSWKKTLTQMKTAENAVCLDLAELLRGTEATYQALYTAFSDAFNTESGPLRLCGLSLGGVLALHYAIDHPEKVDSLVLLATPYQMPKRLLQFQNMLFRLMPNSMFQQMGFGKKEFLKLCKSMMALDLRASLSRVSCPTLVICGERDHANRKASVKLAEQIANAELQMLPDTGHEVNTEAPGELAVLLDNFGKSGYTGNNRKGKEGKAI